MLLPWQSCSRQKSNWQYFLLHGGSSALCCAVVTVDSTAACSFFSTLQAGRHLGGGSPWFCSCYGASPQLCWWWHQRPSTWELGKDHWCMCLGSTGLMLSLQERSCTQGTANVMYTQGRLSPSLWSFSLSLRHHNHWPKFVSTKRIIITKDFYLYTCIQLALQMSTALTVAVLFRDIRWKGNRCSGIYFKFNSYGCKGIHFKDFCFSGM